LAWHGVIYATLLAEDSVFLLINPQLAFVLNDSAMPGRQLTDGLLERNFAVSHSYDSSHGRNQLRECACET
jgi:hypothetical protein